MKVGEILLFLKGIEKSWGLGILLEVIDNDYEQVHKIYFPEKGIGLLYTSSELVNNTMNISKRS